MNILKTIRFISQSSMISWFLQTCYRRGICRRCYTPLGSYMIFGIVHYFCSYHIGIGTHDLHFGS
ncbi:hypothetical protein WN66_02874 [Saccharomyces cerevisiae]|nr:hypothetical protein WN66_02867 [Saccharomyces cerevisiae]KZV10783.1 hypothetical protein WN66_02874 [Saccharomyces cerevisiae]